jgi:hypothetical protein
VTPEVRLATGIQKALASAGIEATQVKVTAYDPHAFGNHIAHVETTSGAIEVVFDRQYELDLMESGIAPARAPDITAALSHEFSALINAGL